MQVFNEKISKLFVFLFVCQTNLNLIVRKEEKQNEKEDSNILD